MSIEPFIYALLVPLLLAVTYESIRRVPKEDYRWVGLILGLALLLRLSVPFVVTNWYFGMSNVEQPDFYTRPSTYVPFINRFLVFEVGQTGIAFYNIVLGVWAPLLLYAAVLRFGYSRRTALFFLALLALTPLYVRLSHSDSSHQSILLFFASASVEAMGQ